MTSVHQLARVLHLEVVAEGVEDESTAEALRDLPGTMGQGWYFGHPEPPEAFARRFSPPS